MTAGPFRDIPADEAETHRRARRAWGDVAQLDMAVEEAAEFIHAVEKYKRGRVLSTTVLEELVDLTFMLDQVRMMLDDAATEYYWHITKLKRIRERLDIWEEQHGKAWP